MNKNVVFYLFMHYITDRVFQKSTFFEIFVGLFFCVQISWKVQDKNFRSFGGHLTPPPIGHHLYRKFAENTKEIPINQKIYHHSLIFLISVILNQRLARPWYASMTIQSVFRRIVWFPSLTGDKIAQNCPFWRFFTILTPCKSGKLGNSA